jgi:hypothetical protein
VRSYRWDLYNNLSLDERYSSSGIDPIVELTTWRVGAVDFGVAAAGDMRAWLHRLVHARGIQQSTICPRVFISHRQADKTLALQLAHAAHVAGFDYWLDVIDLKNDKPPFVKNLEARLLRPLTDVELGFLTAAIIEMALLNCTHVVAAMTNNTAGSQWVSYEYGRIKQRLPSAENASAWLDRATLNRAALPEYMELSPVHERRSDLANWFARQRRADASCDGSLQDEWPHGETEALPD